VNPSPYTLEIQPVGDNGSARLLATIVDNSTGGKSDAIEVTRERLGEAAGRLVELMPTANVVDVERKLRETIEEGEVPDKFIFHNAAEFDALDLRRAYHVPGMLAAGPVPTVMAGSFKTLKTSIAMDMAISLATGGRFLGHFDVSGAVTVAVMSGESGGFALQSLARRIARARGWTMPAIRDRLRICTNVLNTGDTRDLDRIERFIGENEIGLMMIDPAYLAMGGVRSDDAGSLFAMGRFLEPLSRIGERTGCTPLIVHHNSRGATRANPGEPAELADIAWSGFAEWAGQWLLLARRERYNPDSDGEHRLWLTAGGRDGHSNLVGVNVVEGRSDDIGGRQWDVTVEQASRVRRETVEAEQERRDQDRKARLAKQAGLDKQAVLDAVRGLPNGDTKTAIRDRSGLRNERFNPVFAAMLTEGLLVSCEVKKANGQTYPGYAPAPHSNAPGRTGTHSGNLQPSECTSTHSDGLPFRESPSV
jgi:hypothetical protein